MPSDDQHAKAISRLMAAGNMTHKREGQYTADHVTNKGRNTIPEYNRVEVRAAFPTMKEFNFDEDDMGCFVLLRDGLTDEVTRVQLGVDPPATTELLIELVRAHYCEALNTDALKETAGIFAAMDDES